MVLSVNDASPVNPETASTVRLEALQRIDLLDSPPERAFDRLTELTRRLLQAPISLLSLLDKDREIIKSSQGLAEPWASRRAIPLSHSFGQHVVASGQPLVINDARECPLVCDNLAIKDYGAIAYLGAPLYTQDGQVIGALSAIDSAPRTWSEDDIKSLSDLASVAMTEVAMRMREQVETHLRQSESQNRFQAHLLDVIEEAVIATDARGRITFWNHYAETLYGWKAEELLGHNVMDLIPAPTEQMQAQTAEIIAKLMRGENWGGEFLTRRRDGTDFWAEVVDSAMTDEHGQVTGFIGISRDISERRHAVDRIERLQRMTAALSLSVTPDQVAEVIMQECVGALDAVAGAIHVLAEDGHTLVMAGSVGYSEDAVAGNGRIPLAEPGPRSDVMRTAQPIWFESQTDLLARYPLLPDKAFEFGRHAGAILPLKVEDRPIGVMVLAFSESRRLSTADRDFVLALAGQCAQAYERARFYEAERRARVAANEAARTSAFLAQTSQALTASLDFETSIHTLVRLAVPYIADWCAVTMLELDGSIRLVKVGHVQPEKAEWIAQWVEHDLAAARSASGIHLVFRTGQPVSYPEIADEQISAFAGGDAQLYNDFQASGTRSLIMVPLTVYGHTFGALTLAMADSGRRYSPDDLRLAEEWARHAALPVDNTRLYRTLQVLNTELEERVVQRTAELNASHNQLRRLAARLQTAREEERTRMAREVHDVIGQLLTAVKMDVSALGQQLAQENSSVVGKVKDINKMLDSTIKSVRKVATELRPSILDDLGLVAAVEWQLREFEDRSGILCAFACTEEKIPMDGEKATAVFRLVQEALTNVARHAQATEIQVEIREAEGNLFVEIRDNGRGITEQELRGARSLGLLGMRERMHLLSGQLDIQGVPGKGTTVSIRIPLAESD